MLLFFLFPAPLKSERMEKRGFVVKDEEGKVYLCNTPGLKSCCVKKEGVKIELVGDFGELSTYCVVTLTGDYQEDSDGGKLISE